MDSTLFLSLLALATGAGLFCTLTWMLRSDAAARKTRADLAKLSERVTALEEFKERMYGDFR